MKLKNVLGSMVVAAGAAAMNAAPVFAAVSCPTGTERAGDSVSSIAECNIIEDTSLMSTVQTIINVILGVLGIVAVAVIVLGGVSYTTSAGDPGKVKKAKDTIMYGVIGLVVALLAYAIVNFVLSSVFA